VHALEQTDPHVQPAGFNLPQNRILIRIEQVNTDVAWCRVISAAAGLSPAC
jgi:hypothetical protein